MHVTWKKYSMACQRIFGHVVEYFTMSQNILSRQKKSAMSLNNFHVANEYTKKFHDMT
jgi:hypothetical protein